MGCGASTTTDISHNTADNPYTVEVNEVWVEVKRTLEVPMGKKNPRKNLVIKRLGWKTIRVFVSSTFKDFHQEREVLVKKVFPDLRVWCESRRLYLVECDLRWGVPKDYNNELTMRACLGEIDRCYQDNVMPFFLNMTSERIGWIPAGDQIPETVRSEYKWIEGLSITEMEILHGAYRNDNPNSLFMLRDPSFLEQVPENQKTQFIDSQPIAPCKLDILKKMIQDRFPKDRVKHYKVNYSGCNESTEMVEFGGLEETFYKEVFNFFKKRIEVQYPLTEEKLDIYQHTKEQHEAFLKNRCQSLIGRQDVLKKVQYYICQVSNDVPFMILGDAGGGKSSIMAKVADVATTQSMEGRIPGGDGKHWHVFYHFVGAVPGSTELLGMLRRLLKEIQAVDDNSMPSDLDQACQLTCSTLANPKTNPIILVIDALNQFDEDKAAELVSWVPRKLAPHVRCVFSMIPGTAQDSSLVGREPQPHIMQLQPLNIGSRKTIVHELLGRYNKHLDEEQMSCLLSKPSSENPLWLSIACEELRVFGHYRQVSDKINQLAGGLLELEMQILDRFEKENGGELLVATLCLLEVSARGLLETELLTMLGDEQLLPTEGSTGQEDGVNFKMDESEKDVDQLPAYKWAEVYRALRPFLRPFGDSGEGRLDFYHRSLSKAVRKKYFGASKPGESNPKHLWWQSKLADYFDAHCCNFCRKLEEYPVHLIAIADRERLESYLTGWDVTTTLFDLEYSYKLLKYWREGSNFERLEECYTTLVNNWANRENVDAADLADKYEIVARILTQAGRLTKAMELGNKALHTEKEKLGERPHKMAMLYYLQGVIKDEEMKLEEYMYHSQLPDMYAIVHSYECAANILKELPQDIKNKKIMGRIYNRMSFYYSGYAIRGGDEKYSAEESTRLAQKVVDDAITIFTEMGDEHHVADSLLSKAVSCTDDAAEQLRIYKECEEQAIRVSGTLNTIMDLLYLNMGIYYEDHGDKEQAFHYFYKMYEVCRDLYGQIHPKMARSISILQEAVYRKMAAEKGIEIPELQGVPS